MTENQAPRLHLAVIVADCCHVVNGDGETERRVRIFDLPEEVAAYIREAKRNAYVSVSLALGEESPT